MWDIVGTLFMFPGFLDLGSGHWSTWQWQLHNFWYSEEDHLALFPLWYTISRLQAFVHFSKYIGSSGNIKKKQAAPYAGRSTMITPVCNAKVIFTYFRLFTTSVSNDALPLTSLDPYIRRNASLECTSRE